MSTLIGAVLEDLSDHLEVADRLTAQYARSYVESLQGGPRVRPPVGLHPQLAALVRELALDAAAINRRHHGDLSPRRAA